MNYDNLFNTIAAEPSSNAKLAILKSHKDDLLLKEIIRLTLDPFTNFWIKKMPEYEFVSEKLDLDLAIKELDKISSRYYTGYAAIDWLQEILELVSPDNAKVIERIVARDLRCGVSESTVNKVWPKLIPSFPVMLCSAYNQKLIDKIKFPAIVQKKEDGMRFNAVVYNNTVALYTRNGKPIEFLDKLEAEFLKLANGDNVVYDGELLVYDFLGYALDRKTGNGILNKALKGTLLPEDADRVGAVLWDWIPYEDFKNEKSYAPYHVRHNHLLMDYARSIFDRINLIESTTVQSLDEVYTIFEEYLSKGFEGVILKDNDSLWENKRSTKQIKLKGEEECDLRCTSIIEGNGKYTGLIGGLFCESRDGKLTVTVGTGLSDEMRTQDDSYFLDKIIAVKYNQRISNKHGGESLFLPVFLEVRLDKDTADSIEDIR